jgi:hypothetical protein
MAVPEKMSKGAAKADREQLTHKKEEKMKMMDLK